MTDDNNGRPWALITGASSGLGVDFAHELAAAGSNLILVARRRERMQKLADKLYQHHGVNVRVVALDLAQQHSGTKLKAILDAEDIAVDTLINNAGFGMFGEFHEQPLERTLSMLQLNMASLTELTHLFGSDMARREHGQILLVSSVVAYQPSPNYAAYAATKSYVLSLGEALHEELKPYGVIVTVLSPGSTATEFFDVSGQEFTAMKRAFMMRSRPVARIGLAAMRRGKASVVSGWKNKLMTWSTRLAPRILQRKIAHRVLSKK